MSQIKNPEQFTAIEYGLQHYFDAAVSPVMKQVRDDLNKKQTKELSDYMQSPAGILASAMPYGMTTDPVQAVRMTGKWNSKTTEDYIQMVNTKIQQSGKLQQDFALFAEQWRDAAIKQMGRNKYDALSKQLGCDLAYAYVGARMEDLMVNKLVHDGMPKSSAAYIIRKAAQSSIWGLTGELMKSPLTKEIEERGEKAYHPSTTEKMSGRAVGSAMDAISMGGAGAWKSFASFVGVDLIAGYAIDKVTNTQQKKELTMEAAISKGVFGSNKNVFNEFRKDAKKLNGADNDYLKSLNQQLNRKIYLNDYQFKPMAWNTNATNKYPFPISISETNNAKYKNVPLVVAPGKEEEYLANKAKYDAQKVAQAKAERESLNTEKQEESSTVNSSQQQQGQQQEQQPLNNNSGGWLDLLANATGMDGFSNVFGNLGYSLAMLPDVIVGMFTGKTKSLNMKNTMIPLALIMAGLFTKNPIIKTLLISMGGINLLNKSGKEALSWKQQENEPINRSPAAERFKTYPDESLNSRLQNPVLRGNCLIATIDNIPCTIQLTNNVIDAFNSGALPLNTLANAVLAKNDQMRQMAQQNYGERENETIQRTRGIQ